MSNRSVFKRSPLSREAFFLVLTLLATGPLGAQENLCEQIAEVRKIFDERKNAVVRIEAFDHHGKVAGTGFFADPSGTIYTLAGIVANADEIFVVQGDKRLPAELLIADARSGVALIKADCKSPFIPIGGAKVLSLADPVMAIGFPMEMDATPTFGIIGGFDRKFLGKYFVTTHLRANMPVQAGFSGAPLLNLEGRAVGIIVAGIGNGSACYALPIEAAEKIRMDYARFGKAQHGWVGVTVEDAQQEVEGSHVRITELGPDTPASKAGLQNGDMLLQVGPVKISDVEDVIDAAYYLTADDKVTVRVVRDGQTLDIDVISKIHPALDPREPNIGVLESLTNDLKLGGGK
jgi:S1-C subfamily serine protease